MIRETKYDHLFESQKQYRQVLDAMSKPGTVQVLLSDIHVPACINQASAIFGFILMNSDVTFYNAFNSDELNQYFTINTSSRAVAVEEADFIYCSGKESNIEIIEKAKSGLPEYPEGGAFVIIDVDNVSNVAVSEGIEITLDGPGVDGQKVVFAQGLNEALLDQLLEKNIEYPLGVDIILSDKNGQIICIPRSNKFNYKAL